MVDQDDLQNVSIDAKIQRAEFHLNNLYGIIDSIPVDYPHVIATYTSLDGSLFVGELQFARRVPIAHMALIMGDAIHNLRSALDYLACSLVVSNGGTVTTQTAFPIGRDKQAYDSVKRRAVSGMNERAVRILDRIAPYGNGGNGLFWLLHRLDIEDKHRLIMPAPALPTLAEMNRLKINGVPLDPIPSEIEIPLEDGVELFRFEIPHNLRKLDMNVPAGQFGFTLTLMNPPIVREQPLREVVDPLFELVQKTVNIFRRYA